MAESLFQRSFAGGELSPSVYARADLVKYVQGLRSCLNFIVLRQGGVANRAGFRFVAPTKQQTQPLMLMPYFAAEPEDSVLIEVGTSYMRFYQDGALLRVAGIDPWDIGTAYEQGDLVEDGGVFYYAKQATTGDDPPNTTFWHALTDDIYEIPHTFGAELFNFSQSGEVITLTSHVSPPMELIFIGLTQWVLRQVVTEPGIEAPDNLVFTAGTAGAVTRRYRVTAASASTYEESLASGTITGTSAGPTEAAPDVIDWDPVTGAIEYYVYKDKEGNGVFGYIGTATTNQFKDTNFNPDYLSTPPQAVTLFDALNEYPAYAGYYQQRRFFANTLNDPQVIHGSRTGLHSNFNVSTPIQDDDAVTLRIAGKHYHAVKSLIGMKHLIAMTAGGEWTISGGESGVITPSSIHADQDTYAGVAAVPPVEVGNSIVYVQSRKSIVRAVSFQQEVEGLAGRDLTLYAAHLFDGYQIERLEFQQVPNSIVWAVRSDGTLLGLTYLPEEDVWGWHRHTTGAGGRFEDICVVPEADEDALYAIVRRTIDGATVRYVERLESRLLTNFDEDVFFVDSGLSYSGAPADEFTGLEHLEGEVVAVVADGAVLYNGDPDGANAAAFTVTGGAITLAAEYSNVHIGLRYVSDIELLTMDLANAEIRDAKKRIGSVTLLLDKSGRSFYAGPSAARLTKKQAKPREATGDQFTGQVEMAIQGTFNEDGRVMIRQTDPLPLAIMGVIPNAEIGG